MDLQTLKDSIAALPVIDTHEHWAPESFIVNQPIDFFDLLTPYCVDNLLSSGMSMEEWTSLSNRETPFETRWSLLSPYLDHVIDTTYFQTLQKTLRAFHGFTGYTLDAAQAVNKQLAAENRTGLYQRVMKTEHIETVLTFVGMDGPAAFHDPKVLPIPTVSDICPHSVPDVEALSRFSGIHIHDMDSLLLAIDALFDKYKAQGVRGVKFGSAYRRTLDFQARSRQEAEACFLSVLSNPYMGDSRIIGARHAVHSMEQLRPLDDYLTDRMLELARERDMPVFFHAGIHAWNENSLKATHAAFLENLIRRHLKTTFILLHCGVPFVDEAILLCKYFSNVHLNMTWFHIIDRAQARQCVRKYVELLPLNKIHGFGGDYMYPQQIHGHLAIARDNIAEGLWELVEEGSLSAERAVTIARKWLYENPKTLLAL